MQQKIKYSFGLNCFDDKVYPFNSFSIVSKWSKLPLKYICPYLWFIVTTNTLEKKPQGQLKLIIEWPFTWTNDWFQISTVFFSVFETFGLMEWLFSEKTHRFTLLHSCCSALRTDSLIFKPCLFFIFFHFGFSSFVWTTLILTMNYYFLFPATLMSVIFSMSLIIVAQC